MFDFFDMLDNYEQRKVENTIVGNVEIDTAAVTDSDDPYETGIKSPLYNSDNWVIVETYPTKEDAIKGHERWVEIMKTPPDTITDTGNSIIQKFIDSILDDLDEEKVFINKGMFDKG